MLKTTKQLFLRKPFQVIETTLSLYKARFLPQSTQATRYLRFSVEIEKALYPRTSEGLYSNVVLEKEHIFLVISGDNF